MSSRSLYVSAGTMMAVQGLPQSGAATFGAPKINFSLRKPSVNSKIPRNSKQWAGYFENWVQQRKPEPSDVLEGEADISPKGVEIRVHQLELLRLRAVETYRKGLSLSESQANALFEEIMRDHPTAFGYHTPEHSHQSMFAMNYLLGILAKQTPDERIQTIRGLRGDLDVDRPSMTRRFRGEYVANRRTINNLKRALREDIVAPERRHRITGDLRSMENCLQRQKAEIVGRRLLEVVLSARINAKMKAAVLVAALLHDIDPSRPEGTLSRVSETLRWIDGPGERVLRLALSGIYPKLSDQTLQRIKRQIKSLIQATDFQYDGTRKRDIWPKFKRMLVEAGDASTYRARSLRLWFALGYYLRVADQIGSYTRAASLTPKDPVASLLFMEGMVRGLARELRKSDSVPARLGQIGPERLLAGTHRFLTERDPGSPTSDPQVVEAFVAITLLGVPIHLIHETASWFESRFFSAVPVARPLGGQQ